jgi:hypothetical protein
LKEFSHAIRTLAAIAAAVTLATAVLTAATAEARPGWRGWGPGFGIYVGPRPYYRDYSWRYRHAYPYYGRHAYAYPRAPWWRHRDRRFD